MELQLRKHVVLVPGFCGFDALGSLRYYEGVSETLNHEGELPLALHFFPNVPTAGVETRSRALARWIAKRFHRETIRDGDELHLVGHSTGGLDIRQMVYNLRQNPDEFVEGTDVRGDQLLEAIRSIQCLSTPHRGTNLAVRAWPLRKLLFMLATVFGEKLRFKHQLGSGLLGHVLRHIIDERSAPDVLDALIDTLCSFWPKEDKLDRSDSRKRYFDALCWLGEIAWDIAAVKDLHPLEGDFVATRDTPARWPSEELEKERRWLVSQTPPVRARSIVTVASPIEEERSFDVFKLLHGLIEKEPPPSLGPASVDLTPLLKPQGRSMTIDRKSNDGIVTSVSMTWPKVDEGQLVEADHGDIIGHFVKEDLPNRRYDLLWSRTKLPAPDEHFHRENFEAVWRAIREWIVE